MPGILTLTSCTHPDTARMAAARAAGEFFWLDLLNPDDAELERLGALLGWHPLLVEDLQHGDQRAKVEDFEDHTFVVTYAASFNGADQRLVLHEHGLVVHGDYLVTVRHADEPALDTLRAALGSEGGVSEAGVVHRVLDAIVDTTMNATDAISDEVDRLEASITTKVNPSVLDELRACRRDLVTLRSTGFAQRDALGSLSGALERIPGFEVGLRDHFRDVFDHAYRVADELEVARALLDAAFEAYYTMLVAKQGVVAQRLTVIATIFLPLTFVTGFFGQNFDWMVESISTRTDFLVLGVGTSALTGVLLTVIFLRLRWW